MSPIRSLANFSDSDLDRAFVMAASLPDQRPMPARFLRPSHILWRAGDWEARRPFSDLLLDVLVVHVRDTFGIDWAREQEGLSDERRHAVFRWLQELAQEHDRAKATTTGSRVAIGGTGLITELVWFADDLFRLRIAGALHHTLVERLRDRREFQGARYEAAVAASFVRSGFQLAWLGGSGKHGEFEATHLRTGETIVVEAKCARVRGTMNEMGEKPSEAQLKFRAHRHYNDAVKQCPSDRPSAIFIEVTLPGAAVRLDHIPWSESARAMLASLDRGTPESPNVEFIVVLTSFGAHLAGSEIVRSWSYSVWLPKFTMNRVHQLETLACLLRGIETYGFVPPME
ncbi:MAG: hypothetical protein KDA05_06750 [Phycisphaerales bacterium]|nr:hypothetical protein [Phycisphaerales bacterium]